MSSISDILSATIWPMPYSKASDISLADLLFPWKYILEGARPEATAQCISPPLTTSAYMPSSLIISTIAPHRNALEAYTTLVSNISDLKLPVYVLI